MSDFMSDYWLYHSCYEIPRNYALWSALGLISSVMNRKLCYLHGDIEIFSPMYIGLIGPPNQKKSTPVSFAKNLFSEACPDLHIGPSRTSPEKIVQLMAEKDFERCFHNELDEPISIRPYAFFINEFKNFLGRGPLDMINFLTDIYDVKRYPAATLCRGLEDLINPSISILMCETPSWFISNMKGNLITGGIARRFVLVYEMDPNEPRPLPIVTPDARDAWNRVKQRIIDIRKLTGTFKWGNGFSAYERWYLDNFKRVSKENNDVMRGYLGSKNVQLYKVMMLFDAVSEKPMFTFSSDLVEMGLHHLNAIERNLPKLFSAAGRNEMMASQQKLLEIIENGWKGKRGWIPDKQLRKEIEGELNGHEIYTMMRHLEETGQIAKILMSVPNEDGVNVERQMILLPKRLKEMITKDEVRLQPDSPHLKLLKEL